MYGKTKSCKTTFIRERRIALHMTQAEVAAEIGIDLQQYQRYEYGGAKLSNARMKVGLRICAALKLDPFEAVFENDENFAGAERQETGRLLPQEGDPPIRPASCVGRANCS